MNKIKGADPGMDFAHLVDRFAGKKICVIGDIIADVNIFGKPYRLSREAPVIVVKYEGTQVYPGSAGNTINNLLALGAQVYPVGFIGKDSTGNKLIDYFARYKTVETKGIIRVDKPTITKTRILAGDTHTSKQQVIRIDREDESPYSKSEKTALMDALAKISPHVDAIVVSDYGHGVVHGKVIDYMKVVARDKAVIGDSRYNLKKFSGFTLITPNESEAYPLSGLKEDAAIEEVGGKILESMQLAALLITRGNEGMSLFRQKGIVDHIPISGKDDVTDVTGAGDTVCAVAALAIASGADFYTASRIANYAAGVVVMKRGTATVGPEELKTAMMQGA
jgi:D-glycero-beta-D-manno-heptose-7-phosphate kinase